MTTLALSDALAHEDRMPPIDRIIDVSPAEQQQQVRVQLSTSLQGIVNQQLVPTVDGEGRVGAAEILVATPAVRALIRAKKVPMIVSAMQTGRSRACGRWTHRWPSWYGQVESLARRRSSDATTRREGWPLPRAGQSTLHSTLSFRARPNLRERTADHVGKHVVVLAVIVEPSTRCSPATP